MCYEVGNEAAACGSPGETTGAFLTGLGTMWTLVGAVGLAWTFGAKLRVGAGLASISAGIFPGLVLLALGAVLAKIADVVDLEKRLVVRLEEDARPPTSPGPTRAPGAPALGPYGPTPPWERGTKS